MHGLCVEFVCKIKDYAWKLYWTCKDYAWMMMHYAGNVCGLSWTIRGL